MFVRYLLLSAFAVLLVLPMSAQAQSLSVSQAVARMNTIITEMEKLRDEFRQLAASVDSSAGTPTVLGAQTSSGPVFTESLTYGSTNDDIKRIQKLLATDPEIYPYGVASGFYGPKTEEAINNLQVRSGWDPVGVVGPATRALLEGYFKAYPDENWPTDVLKSEPPTPQVLGASTDDPQQQLADAMQALSEAQAKQTSSGDNPARSIEADVDRGEASVKIVYQNGNTKRLTVTGDTNSEIIESIASRTVLTEAQVKEVIEFDGDSDDDNDRSSGDEDEAEEALDDADDAIDDADDAIEEADDDGEDVDWAEDTLEDAEDLYEEAEEAYDDEDYDEAIELAEEAEDMADDARSRIGDEKGSKKGDNDEIEEIVADVEEDESEITVEYEDGEEYEFTVEEDKEDEIIEEVADELNMDEDDVEDLIEFRYGDVDSIEVRIDEDEDEASVEVNYESGVTLRFTINETDEDDIIEEIADRIDEDEDDVEDWTDFD